MFHFRCEHKTLFAGDTCNWCGRDKRKDKGFIITTKAAIAGSIAAVTIRLAFFHNGLNFDTLGAFGLAFLLGWGLAHSIAEAMLPKAYRGGPEYLPIEEQIVILQEDKIGRKLSPEEREEFLNLKYR